MEFLIDHHNATTILICFIFLLDFIDLANEGDREWKRLNSKDLGISSSMIAKSTRKVLNGLKSKG